MGLFESIRVQATELLTGASGSDSDPQGGNAVLGTVMQAVRQHGLQDLVQKLHAGGLRDVVASWIGTGTNLPITAEQLESGLGRETIETLAARLGIPPEQATALLSRLLPHAVDRLTPGGNVDATAADETSVEPEPCAQPEPEPTER